MITMMEMKMINYFNMLPQDCVCKVFSLTSPLDACRSSLVSSSFRSAMESDIVWDKFLPPDWLDVVSRSVSPLKFSSKKELFARLCHPFLIDSGKMSFKLEKSSGKKCYLLSARALSITWSDNPIYWSWVFMAESRFSEVAVLRTTDWLEIKGRLRTQMLSPNTVYGAYLVFKISDRAYGLDAEDAETSVEVGDQLLSVGKAYLGSSDRLSSSSSSSSSTELADDDGYNMKYGLKMMVKADDDHDHDHGWMEIELGEFFIGDKLGQDDDHDVVKMSLKEVKGYKLKGGIIIEGIEVRPKHLTIFA